MHTDDNSSQNSGTRDASSQSATARSPMDFTSPYAPVDASDAHSLVRPLGLTAISVLCILAGVLGLLVGLLGIAQTFLSETIANFANASAPSGDMADAQREMQQKIQAITDQYFVPSLLALSTKVALAVCLLVGGVGLIQSKFWSLQLLRRSFIACIVLEVAYAILQGLVQLKTAPVMQEFFGSIASNGSDNGAPGSAVMSQMMSVGMIIGVAFMVVWALIKIGIFIWARLYLGRPLTQEYLRSQSGAAH